LKVNWQNKEIVRIKIKNKRFSRFLFENGSLSRLIRDQFRGRFHIDLISESWCIAMKSEKKLLSLRDNETTFIRESYLSCNNKKLVYARTVIPRQTLKKQNQNLTRLGQKPLGEILFNNNKIYRENIKYAKIPLSDELHSKAREYCNISSELYGRQSMFYIKNKPIIVIEVFLPDIIK
jgi:chorismate--pyruvate lyase|tara:strand:- start:284 stop:817 length:534 start_codon:yes stop_codon:yes gene_type:complete